jgi:hypothetical protein
MGRMLERMSNTVTTNSKLQLSRAIQMTNPEKARTTDFPPLSHPSSDDHEE